MPQSPVDPSAPATRVDSFAAPEIVDAYSRIGVDVRDYFGDVSTVEVYRCERTGYRYYHPFSLAGRADLYERLQTRPGYYRLKHEHRVARTFIESSHSVLEVGCGEGLFLSALAADGIAVTGLEFNDLAVRKATAAGLAVSKQDVTAFAATRPEAFDVVCTFQVLEHVPDVKPFVDGMLSALKPGGLLVLGVPNNNPYLYRSDRLHALNLPPHHMGLWNRESLQRLADAFPMDVVQIDTEPFAPEDLPHYLQVNLPHPRAARIATRALTAVRPQRLRNAVLAGVSSRLPGRNLLAVYRKH
jgi:SAM-dependent methyltransferase